MRSSQIDFKFPVLVMDAAHGHMDVYVDRSELEISSPDAIKKNLFSGLQLVDTGGRSWLAQSAEKVGSRGILGGWTPFLMRRIKVDWILSEENSCDLPNIQRSVFSVIDRNREFWSAGADPEQIKDALRPAADIRSFMERLRKIVRPAAV